jgi:hypothetical protein
MRRQSTRLSLHETPWCVHATRNPINQPDQSSAVTVCLPVVVVVSQCEKLAAFDDIVADAYLSALDDSASFGVDTPGLTPADLIAGLRRVTIHKAGKAVVLLCGAAYRNKVRCSCSCILIACSHLPVLHCL